MRYKFEKQKPQQTNVYITLYAGFLPHIQTYIASKVRDGLGTTALVACSSDCTKKIEKPCINFIHYSNNVNKIMRIQSCWLHTNWVTYLLNSGQITLDNHLLIFNNQMYLLISLLNIIYYIIILVSCARE